MLFNSMCKHLETQVLITARMYVYMDVYILFSFHIRRMDKLTSLKDKFEKEGNGVLPGLLA